MAIQIPIVPNSLICKVPSFNFEVGEGIPNYNLKEILDIRRELNSAKDRLNPIMDNPIIREQWGSLQGARDSYANLRGILSRDFNGQNVSNAWIKYYELLTQFNLLERSATKGKLSAFFNAELPGASLCALNHLHKTKFRSLDFEWHASSFIPEETIKELASKSANPNDWMLVTNKDGEFLSETSRALGDKYGLLAANPDKWMMTSTNNGDMTKLQNIKDIVSRLGTSIDLYSHDAGVGGKLSLEWQEGMIEDENLNSKKRTYFNVPYNWQEELSTHIHLGCDLNGLEVLKKGGSFIAKHYTIFEPTSWNAMLIYATLFEEFYLVKPAASRPENSEVYYVGLNFKGLPSKIKQILEHRVADFKFAPFIPESSITPEMRNCISQLCHCVFDAQIMRVNADVTAFLRKQLNRKEMIRIGITRQKQWIDSYNVVPIDKKDWLIGPTASNAVK